MTGTLYGIGVGPGDPELLTIKATRLIAAADVIAYHAAGHGRSIARASAAPYLRAGQLEEPLIYPVTTGPTDHPGGYGGALADFYAAASARLAAHLDAGRNVALLAEGDPTLFSSCLHMQKRLATRYPCVLVPGVTAVAAAAAAAGTPLVEGDEVLAIVPGTLPAPALAAAVASADAVALMKVSRNVAGIRAALAAAGRLDEAVYVRRASHPDQAVAPFAAADPDAVPYMSTVIVPGRRASSPPAADSLPGTRSSAATSGGPGQPPTIGSAATAGGPDPSASPDGEVPRPETLSSAVEDASTTVRRDPYTSPPAPAPAPAPAELTVAADDSVPAPTPAELTVAADESVPAPTPAELTVAADDSVPAPTPAELTVAADDSVPAPTPAELTVAADESVPAPTPAELSVRQGDGWPAGVASGGSGQSSESAKLRSGERDSRPSVPPAELSRRTGEVVVVGLGPAGEEWLTPQARAELAAAEHVVGYGPYVDRVPAAPGQRRHASDNRVEAERAEFALELARRGARVAVVSSGDPGVFAMASAVLETRDRRGYQDVAVRVLPGVTAANAVASRAGAPLGHDYCVLSLSDQLKPWDVIKTRLAAAAAADLVLALYNPASKARQGHLKEVRDLLLEHRAPDTPVVVGRAVGAEDESVTVIRLEDLAGAPVDMRTLLIVGSSRTVAGKEAVYTPRSY
jgi:precorrin-2 C20-methyltransferase/precorrin-3B C17-methyltransferase